MMTAIFTNALTLALFLLNGNSTKFDFSSLLYSRTFLLKTFCFFFDINILSTSVTKCVLFSWILMPYLACLKFTADLLGKKNECFLIASEEKLCRVDLMTDNPNPSRFTPSFLPIMIACVFFYFSFFFLIYSFHHKSVIFVSYWQVIGCLLLACWIFSSLFHPPHPIYISSCLHFETFSFVCH